MKKFSARLKEVKFEFEFSNGDVDEFSFRDMNTKQIKKFSNASDVGLDDHIELLESNIKGNEASKRTMIQELEEDGNIFEFIGSLQEELGKLKKRG